MKDIPFGYFCQKEKRKKRFRSISELEILMSLKRKRPDKLPKRYRIDLN